LRLLPPPLSPANIRQKPIRIIAQFTPRHFDRHPRAHHRGKNEPGLGPAGRRRQPSRRGAVWSGPKWARRAPPDGYYVDDGGVECVRPSIRPCMRSCRTTRSRISHPSQPWALTPQTLVANPASAFKSVKDFVAAAKDKPGQISYASLGNGSTSHLTMEMFPLCRRHQAQSCGHSRAAPEAHTQIIGGQVPDHVRCDPGDRCRISKSGRLRGLGIATLKRSQFFCPICRPSRNPAMAGFEAVGWIGIAARPRKTPAPILDKLNAENGEDHQTSPTSRSGSPRSRFTPVGDTRRRAVFAAYMKSEIRQVGQSGERPLARKAD